MHDSHRLPRRLPTRIALVDRRVTRDPALRPTGADDCRRGAPGRRRGPRRGTRGGSTGWTATSRCRAEEIAAPRRHRAPRRRAGRWPRARATSGASPARSCPVRCAWRVAPGVVIEHTRDAARTRRLLRAGRPVSPAVVAADDRHSGPRRRRPRTSSPPVRASDAVVAAAAIEAGVTRLFRAGRRARDRRAGVRHARGAARRQDRRARQPLRGRRQGARRRRLRRSTSTRGPRETGLGHQRRAA